METALQTTASKYIGRWKHRLTLHFRVWPKYKETQPGRGRVVKREMAGRAAGKAGFARRSDG